MLKLLFNLLILLILLIFISIFGIYIFKLIYNSNVKNKKSLSEICVNVVDLIEKSIYMIPFIMFYVYFLKKTDENGCILFLVYFILICIERTLSYLFEKFIYCKDYKEILSETNENNIIYSFAIMAIFFLDEIKIAIFIILALLGRVFWLDTTKKDLEKLTPKKNKFISIIVASILMFLIFLIGNFTKDYRFLKFKCLLIFLTVLLLILFIAIIIYKIMDINDINNYNKTLNKLNIKKEDIKIQIFGLNVFVYLNNGKLFYIKSTGNYEEYREISKESLSKVELNTFKKEKTELNLKINNNEEYIVTIYPFQKDFKVQEKNMIELIQNIIR